MVRDWAGYSATNLSKEFGLQIAARMPTNFPQEKHKIPQGIQQGIQKNHNFPTRISNNTQRFKQISTTNPHPSTHAPRHIGNRVACTRAPSPYKEANLKFQYNLPTRTDQMCVCVFICSP